MVTNRRLSGMIPYWAVCPDVARLIRRIRRMDMHFLDLEWGTLTGVHVPGHDRPVQVVPFWQNSRLTNGNGPGPAGN
jgi:hypothetical protein